MTGESNPYWTEDHDEEFDPGVVAIAYDIDFDLLSDLLNGEDEMLDADGVSAAIQDTYGDLVPVRTIRYREYPYVISKKKMTRYSKKEVLAYHAKHHA